MEKNLWQQLNTIQKQFDNWHLTRIESTTINGIPDVHCCCNGVSFFLELKANNDKNYGLSKYQIIWQLDYMKAGGKVFNLVFALSQRELKLVKLVPDLFWFRSDSVPHKDRYEVLATKKYNQDNLREIIKLVTDSF